MTHSSSASRRRLERGQFSWVTFALLAGLVVGGYLAMVWVPVWLVHREVGQVVRVIVNRAVKDRNDEVLVVRLCERLRALGDTELVDARGDTVTVPTVDVSPGDVTWERDTSVKPPVLHVAFEYVRVVRYPWLDRSEERVMTVDVTEDIGIPVW